MAYRFGRLTVRDPVFGPLQLEGDGFAAAGEPVRLALNRAVQEQLGLSASAALEAQAIWQRYKEALDADYAEGTPPDHRERAARRRRAEAEVALARLLTSASYRRLQELSWRIRGGDALLDDEVADALALTDEQREALARLARTSETEIQQFYRDISAARVVEADFQERATRQNEGASEGLLSVLTPEQLKAFNELRAGGP